MWYDSVNSKVISKPEGVTINEVQYPPNIFRKWTEEELNAIGIYSFVYDSKPDSRYYTYTATRDTNVLPPRVIYTPIEKDLESLKAEAKARTKHRFIQLGAKPTVDTGLGFSVDGGRSNLQDFQTGQKYALTHVKASDNQFYPVSITDYDTIINAIEQNGIDLFNKKWAKEQEIDALLTLDEIIAFENTPVQSTDEITGEPITINVDMAVYWE